MYFARRLQLRNKLVRVYFTRLHIDFTSSNLMTSGECNCSPDKRRTTTLGTIEALAPPQKNYSDTLCARNECQTDLHTNHPWPLDSARYQNKKKGASVSGERSVTPALTR